MRDCSVDSVDTGHCLVYDASQGDFDRSGSLLTWIGNMFVMPR